MVLLQYLILLPFVASVMVAPEVNMDYEGSVDIYSGAPVLAEDVSQAQTVSLSNGSSYDRSSHTFCYPVSGYDTPISSTVADGMITTDPVAITIPENLGVELYLNGKVMEQADFAALSTPGSYALLISSAESQRQVLTFDIVSKKTGKLTSYSLPDGFLLQEVRIDGVAQSINYSGSVDFTKEGDYEVNYRCTASGISYTLRVTIDHTNPEVTFEGIENGIARGPVTMTGLADGDRVTVTFNGDDVHAPANGIFRSVGKYVVVVTDDAGNAITEEFTIRMYLNMQGGIFIALAIAVFVGAGVYMYVSRKRLRVR